MARTLFLFIFTWFSMVANGQVVTTIAGNNARGYMGDGGVATKAELCNPFYALPDGNGNVYIADWGNGCIRKISSSGIISTIAGNRSIAHTGDGGLAITAGIPFPQCMATDRAGNLYISEGNADRFQHINSATLVDSQLLAGSCIRKINAAGIITTVAGTGSPGFNGDGKQATATQINLVTDMVIDAEGAIYFADYGNMRIRKINTSGIVTTIAGRGSSGFSGDGGQAINAELYYPYGLAIDGEGNIYFTDSYNNRIRKISTSGVITTVAGTAKAGYSGDNGPASTAQFQRPEGIVIDDKKNIFIADQLNYRVRKINDTGLVTTVADNESAGYASSSIPATSSSASFNPEGLSLDNHGNIYVADNSNHTIRKISMTVPDKKQK